MAAAAPTPAILSDDVTGANGVAAMFAARGVPARTLLGPHAVRAWWPAAGIAVIDTATRHATPAEAGAAVAVAVRAALDAGATHIAKRIDTTLRGNIGPEIRAMLDALGGDRLAVIVPAAPDAGRTAVGGRVFVGGQPLSEAMALPDRPLPLVAPFLDRRVATLGLATVRAGAAAVAATLTRAARAGARAILCDAESPADLDLIAAGVARSGVPVAPVDPGGFTLALLSALGAAPPAQDRRRTLDAPGRGSSDPPVPSSLPPAGRILAILGSHTNHAERQLRAAARALPLTLLDLSCAERHTERMDEARRIAHAVAACEATIIGVRAARIAHDGGQVEDDPAIAGALALTAAHTLRSMRPPAGLYLSGGEVARAVLDALGARAIAITDQVLPLAAGGYLLGGPHAGLTIITKGGLVGDDTAITHCLRHLCDRAALRPRR